MKIAQKLGMMLVFASLSNGALANDWEKFYTPTPSAVPAIASGTPPQIVSSAGSFEGDVEAMWKRGFVMLGYSQFNSANSKTKDAERLAKKLKAKFVIVATDLTSSSVTSIPLTMPSTTSSNTSGTVSVVGRGGVSSGTYSGTTTNYGTTTTYIPMTVNRFDKFAMYFAEAPKIGSGIFSRELSPEEVAKYETQRAFAIRFIRDGSPAYMADLLPGDVITHVNDEPADEANWSKARASNEPMNLSIYRNGRRKNIIMTIPADWRPAP